MRIPASFLLILPFITCCKNDSKKRIQNNRVAVLYAKKHYDKKIPKRHGQLCGKKSCGKKLVCRRSGGKSLCLFPVHYLSAGWKCKANNECNCNMRCIQKRCRFVDVKNFLDHKNTGVCAAACECSLGSVCVGKRCESYAEYGGNCFISPCRGKKFSCLQIKKDTYQCLHKRSSLNHLGSCMHNIECGQEMDCVNGKCDRRYYKYPRPPFE